MLYLDNSSTTKILPEVKEVMLPFLMEEFGNPSSKYYEKSLNSKKAVDDARSKVASLLNCHSDEVIFTSGSTESNNMIIKGVCDYYGSSNNHLVTTVIEHPSVIETFRFLESKGFNVTYLKVDKRGIIDLKELESIFENSKPLLVSIMAANNETGSLQPISYIADLCNRYNVFFHSDATQMIGKLKFDLNKLDGLTFLSCSAHKFHGPKGIGVAIIKKDKNGLKTKLTPLLHGGGQEQDYRSGTLAVHNIVGMGKAAEIANVSQQETYEKLLILENNLKQILKGKFKDIVTFNINSREKIPGILSVHFQGINNEVLLNTISHEVAASTGSACSSSKPSHVLAAMGFSQDQIRSTVRFSLSSQIDPSELEIFKSF